MSHVLITGASGLLGLNLALRTLAQGHTVTGWSNSRPLPGAPFETETVNLTDLETLPAAISRVKADLIVNCAALANVDQAEKDPALAQRVNAQAPGVIAATSAKLGIAMVHISTDAVFDGTKGDYSEEDTPNPLNAYARSKLDGEKAVAAANPEALIARVVFYGWSLDGNRSLAEFFYNNLSAEKTVKGFTDMFFTPLYVGDLADLLLRSSAAGLHGLYHVFGANAISKYAFGIALARELNLEETLLSPHSALDSDLEAPRSLNLSMNTQKLQDALGQGMPSLDEGLRALHQAFDAGLREKLKSFSV